MKRLIRIKTRKLAPVEDPNVIIITKDDTTLPRIVEAVRRGNQINIVVHKVEIDIDFADRAVFRVFGNDEGKQWSWGGVYNVCGELMATLLTYAPPRTIDKQFLEETARKDEAYQRELILRAKRRLEG